MKRPSPASGSPTPGKCPRFCVAPGRPKSWSRRATGSLGIQPDAQYQDLELTLEPGDVVVFASDGLPEAPALVRAAPGAQTRAPSAEGGGAGAHRPTLAP